jgi:2-polyprenyl-6-methoxyphenol hydroxylase-like FAD-dependent oxidoreductase
MGGIVNDYPGNDGGGSGVHDVVVVGSGLAGSLAATLLSRRGFDVAILDRREAVQSEFAAEQLVGTQIDALADIGALDAIINSSAVTTRCVAVRGSRVVGTATEAHYGLPYKQIVEGVRAGIPKEVKRIWGSMRTVATMSPGRQIVSCSDRMAIEARLVVLATGTAPLARFGLFRETIRENHSLTLGFDVDTDYRNILAAYGSPTDRIDYLTLFPMGNKVRGNLFAYVDPASDFIDRVRDNPDHMIFQRLFPDLRGVIGPATINSRIEARPTTLYRTLHPEWASGCVLVGDAFQTSCPAVGSGIGRVLTDVHTLLSHAPRWMDAGYATLEEFYRDPIKVETDAEAIRSAEYRRTAATNTSLRWRVRRCLSRFRHRGDRSSTPKLMVGGMEEVA